MTASTTFHPGELAAQRRAGAGDVASWASDFIRDHMPKQHRDFYTSLPFLVVSAADEQSRSWVTVLEGEDGFITSPDPKTLELHTLPAPGDPLAMAMASGTDLGLLGIELSTRRRNRLSGFVSAQGDGLKLAIRQSFGNCPQYIREREWHRVTDHRPVEVARRAQLSPGQMERIGKADTLFIGTGQRGEPDAPSNGYDASHRGGDPGFVKVIDANYLRIPDYAGNNFFNTIGNLLQNPRIGLLFIDFETGGMLHLSGKATIDWEPVDAHDPAARRMIDVEIEAVVDRPGALSLRWQSQAIEKRPLIIADKVVESAEITSLYLYPADRMPRDPFEAGQHLPIELESDGQREKVARSYSLSGSPGDDHYRLSIKRESEGLASRHIHDSLEIGDTIQAGRPSGDFVLPCSQCPLVLITAWVGITPMLSMLHAVAAERGNRELWFVHGARDGAHHALRTEVDRLIGSSPRFHRVVHYSRSLESDRPGRDFDAEGRITPETAIRLGAGADAQYLMCGPAPFLSDIRSGLEAFGIPDDQIHFETFGPSSS